MRVGPARPHWSLRGYRAEMEKFGCADGGRTYGQALGSTAVQVPTPSPMQRTASAVWNGSLKHGFGRLATQSKVLSDTAYTFASRFESGEATNPEELIASAHAGCFTMMTTALLGAAGFTADKLETKASLTLEQVSGAWTITTIALELHAIVPGITAEAFATIADNAKAQCPVSRVLNAKISLTAKLG